MKCKVDALPYFKRKFKRLAKKFRTLPDELDELITLLEKQPQQGKDLGAGLFKLRLGSESKGGGKSGGFRVATYYIEQTSEDEIIYLVTIFDKSEEENITKAELLKIVKKAFG
jgi:hypothetical protein